VISDAIIEAAILPKLMERNTVLKYRNRIFDEN
jgi:hypothetical protein